MSSYYIGVDVGTGSVRAALVDGGGRIVANETRALSINSYGGGTCYEQSSEEIWTACAELIRAVSSALPAGGRVSGCGFCATCSLVLLDADFRPVPVRDAGYDVVMWMDHRAGAEAALVNASGHADVLQYVGGQVSLEMQLPKILWLKRRAPAAWRQVAHLFDLPDYLTFRATGALSRSLCSVTCKWNYSGGGWSRDFLDAVGLPELYADDCAMIGREILAPGQPVGRGLTEESAAHMGLEPGTKVGASLIDAHCGAVGMIGARHQGDNDVTKRLGIICGTSSCHMAVSKTPVFVPGIWGPYHHAMLPGYWLMEGGQSATGKLLDHVVENHPAYGEAVKLRDRRKLPHVHLLLNALLQERAERDQVALDTIAGDCHVWPDYHGNRSPVADAGLRGSVCGLSLDVSLDDLCVQYLACLQALACGSRHIVAELEAKGFQIATVHMCGGLSKNELFVRAHANVLCKPVVRCREPETVLIGAAVLAALAAGSYCCIADAMRELSHVEKVTKPDEALRPFYEKKYKVFLLMLQHQQMYRDVMAAAP